MIYVPGGASLNYKVVGGTSQPASASENTIWVSTSTTITSHVFSITEPASPTEGMVWFKTGNSSPVAFEATKKNAIKVYPTGCQQYENGAWVKKAAKTYRNGAWIEWRTYLYDNGTDNTDLTGGWVGRGSYGTVTDADGVLYTKLKSGSAGTTGSSSTVNPVDLTNANVLYFVVESVTAGGGQVAISPTTSAALDGFTAYTTITKSTAQTIYSIDVSTITGEFYIFTRVTSASTSAGAKVSAIYFE